MSDNDRKVEELRKRFIAASPEDRLLIIAVMTAALIRAEQGQSPTARWLNGLGRRHLPADVVVYSN